MYTINENDGYKFIEIKFNTEDGEEFYLCTGEHTTVYDAFNEMIRMDIIDLDTRRDRVLFAEHVHEIKVHLKIPSPGPLPRLYQQVQWKHSSWRDASNRENNQFIALNHKGETDHNLLKAIVRDDGHVVVYDASGFVRDIFNYPGATLYEKFLNIPTIFPNVE